MESKGKGGGQWAIGHGGKGRERVVGNGHGGKGREGVGNEHEGKGREGVVGNGHGGKVREGVGMTNVFWQIFCLLLFLFEWTGPLFLDKVMTSTE